MGQVLYGVAVRQQRSVELPKVKHLRVDAKVILRQMSMCSPRAVVAEGARTRGK